MIFYIFLALFIWFVCKRIKTSNKNKERFLQALFGGLVCIFLSSCRSINTGSDSLAYYNTFQRVLTLNWHNLFVAHLDMENGFRVFLKIISYVSSSYHWLFFCTSLVSLIPVMIYLYYYSPNIGMGWAIYILSNGFIFEMCTIRQAMAIGICVLNLMYILRNKKSNKSFFISVILVFLCMLIHRSSIVFLPLIFVARFVKKNDIIIYFIIIFGITVLTLSLPYIVDALYNLGILGIKYYQQASEGHGIARIIMPLTILALFFFVRKRMYKIDDNTTVWEMSIIFSFIISVSSFWVFIFSRTNLYYQLLYISIIPKIIDASFYYHNKRIIGIFTMMLFVLYFIASYDANNYYDYIFWN